MGLSPQVRGSPGAIDADLPAGGSIPAGAGEPQGHGQGARRRGVYPRRCGGAAPSGSPRTPTSGLSPQVRGSRHRRPRDDRARGSIPAGAGEPVETAIPALRARVYPRRCGGAPGPAVRPPILPGLSPQVRGSQLPGPPRRRAGRSIPAGAGEPHPSRRRAGSSGVYPRRCGGAATRVAEGVRAAGLSPQVRGSRPPARRGPGPRGSIPAGAGEPCGSTSRSTPPGVYPRRCGGAADRGAGGDHNPGLSPQVRGSHVRGGSAGAAGGSIPAGAGEPPRARAGGRRPWVYPRRCGGAMESGRLEVFAAGLSPQVRGSPRTRIRRCQTRRSIPAGAGEPPPAPPSASPARVYPRRCGGAVFSVAGGASETGLSPQVRGSRAACLAGGVAPGSIPAGAGEPLTPSVLACAARVYPRRCGGAQVPTREGVSLLGLSPQVRGSPPARRGGASCTGSIPAGAGEPAA